MLLRRFGVQLRDSRICLRFAASGGAVRSGLTMDSWEEADLKRHCSKESNSEKPEEGPMQMRYGLDHANHPARMA